MKVKADRTVRYGGETYPAGQEFEMAREDYEQHKEILTVTEDEKAPAKVPVKSGAKQAPQNGLADLAYIKLRKMAKDKGIEGCSKMNKFELIAALEALEADANGGSGDPENPPADPATGQE